MPTPKDKKYHKSSKHADSWKFYTVIYLATIVLTLLLTPNASNAQTSVTPTTSKNGTCVIFYVEMEEYDDFTRSENKHFKSVAKRFADARKGRCYAMNNEDLVVNEINVFKTGQNFIDTLRKISREIGPVSELYIFAHGVPLGIVGASEDSLGIQKMCVASQCVSPADLAFAIQKYLTNNANVVLHSCSVSVTPSAGNFEDQVFDKTPIDTKSSSLKLEQVSASGTIVYEMNITSESNNTVYYNGINANGSLVITGTATIDNKRYPLQKLIYINEFIDIESVKSTQGKHLSIPISPGWFIESVEISGSDLAGTSIELDLKLEPELSFAESLIREIARIDSSSKVTVWGHNNYTKAGYNCGWVKHTVDHPEAVSTSATGKSTDKMPLKLQCGSHKTCDGNSEIVKIKECYE